MAARIVKADEAAALAEAAERLRSGRLVAFPTETVYGLGANALDPEAVARIFETKGRPSTNPVIAHVADEAAARGLAREWPEAAAKLAEKFWPGPLTLVVEKAPGVPDIVTAGGPTVGVRVPDHPVALELLRLAGVPVAAPSANRSEEVSPTTAQHVADSLGPWADDLLILDGGACRVGIESTVVDVTGTEPHVLRPGMLSVEDLGAAAGKYVASRTVAERTGIARSPGLRTRHYAPRAQVILVAKGSVPALQAGDGALVWHSAPRNSHGGDNTRFLPRDPEGYAARLYSALREMDAVGVTRLFIELPEAPNTALWAGVYDRLRRAAAPALSPGPSPPVSLRDGRGVPDAEGSGAPHEVTDNALPLSRRGATQGERGPGGEGKATGEAKGSSSPTPGGEGSEALI